jgi:hypothetical protein
LTIPDFVAAVEGYYGQYRPIQKKMVMSYLSQKSWAPGYLGELFAYLTKTVSCEKHFVPDIAVFERIKRNELQPAAPAMKALPEPEIPEEQRKKNRERVEHILGRKLSVEW